MGTMMTVHDLQAATGSVYDYAPPKQSDAAALASGLHLATPHAAGPLPETATRVLAIVGEPTRFVVAVESIAARFELVRQPGAVAPVEGDGPIAEAKRAIARSAPALNGGTLLPRHPGLHRVVVTISGGWSRTVDVVAVPAALFDRIPNANKGERRVILEAIVRDPKTTEASVIAALETGNPLDALSAGGIHGERSVRIQNYGGGAAA